jgi:Cys-tRNA(Pro)/Cys-tRNA(Cys) deacylase
MKTNAMRILEQHKVAYRLAHYEVDEDDLSATSVAVKVGMAPEQVFKTLVCRGDSGAVCFAIVPANTELDVKVLAKAVGERKTHPVPLKEVQPLTGYIRGGVTVLGAKKAFPAVIDASALLFDEVSVSAGVRGTQVILHPQSYVDATSALVVEDLGR